MNSDEQDVKEVLETAHVAQGSLAIDFGDKDEALRLVGLERTAVFTEEYYARVRRKLASCILVSTSFLLMLV